VKVKKLIRELKKMPQNAEVVFADHDHGVGEFNDFVERVWLGEDELLEHLAETGREQKCNVVVLRG
jgi:hypothetical protein